MPGIAGPPIVPPLPMPDAGEDAPSRKYPRPRYDARDRWSWLAGALFGLLAVVLKLQLWRPVNPPAFFAGLAALVVATLLWHWLVPRPRAVTVGRGALVGAAIGLLVPPAAWLLFALDLLLGHPELLKALSWTFAIATLATVAAVSALSGALAGAILAALGRASTR